MLIFEASMGPMAPMGRPMAPMGQMAGPIAPMAPMGVQPMRRLVHCLGRKMWEFRI